MILVAFILAFAIYLSIFWFVARWLTRYCQRRGKHTLGRWISGLVMFSAFALIFWDAIPTWYTHHRLCKAEAGLKVYMTPEEWTNKYPERLALIQTTPEASSRRMEKPPRINIRIYPINSQIDSVHEDETGYGFGVMRLRRRYVDAKTGEVLAEDVDFAGGVSGGSIATGANSLADYKFWLTTFSCGDAYRELREKRQADDRAFGNIYRTIHGWNKN